MGEVRLKDLPLEAREILTRDLTHENAMWLAIDALRERDASAQASYPADPIEGLRQAREAAHRKVTVETDDPVGLAIDTLEVATAALSRGSFDDHDAGALVTLLHVAWTALRNHRRNMDEANDRVRAILFPQK